MRGQLSSELIMCWFCVVQNLQKDVLKKETLKEKKDGLLITGKSMEPNFNCKAVWSLVHSAYFALNTSFFVALLWYKNKKNCFSIMVRQIKKSM